MVKNLNCVEFGAPIRYNRDQTCVTGDTWACAWADDDKLYTVIDDTAGFDLVYQSSKNRNTAISTFGVTTPPDLSGTMVNGMEAYGRSNQLGADGACWKGNGMISVDGVLYLSVSRHWYHVKSYDNRQIARDCSIVKSDDKGRTWTPHPYLAEPLPDPLFPGPNFATCFFVDYGQDKALSGDLPHEANTYVYTVSTQGYWNNGNALNLARIRRDGLARLKLEDWEFFCGCRGDWDAPIWRPGKPGLESCYPILSRPFSFGQTAMNYIPQLERYVLIGWHYPKLSQDNWDHATSVWDFYQSPAPWGPWEPFFSHTWESEGFYNPSIPSKFISEDGKSGWILTCGNFDTWDKSLDETLYTLFMLPFTFITME